jgi:hypothetical protein
VVRQRDVSVSVVMTPLICGFHASVTIAMRRPRAALALDDAAAPVRIGSEMKGKMAAAERECVVPVGPHRWLYETSMQRRCRKATTLL